MLPDGRAESVGCSSVEERPRRLAPPPVLAWLVLAVSLCATFWVWQQETRTAEQIASQRFQVQVQRIQSDIEHRRDEYVHELQAVSGLFALTDTVSASRWQDYVAALHLDRSYPGLVAIGYVRATTVSALPAFVHQQRRVSPQYHVWPAGARPWLLPVLLHTSFRNRADLTGFDMASMPGRLAAASAARDAGRAVFTSRLPTLLDHRHAAFFIFSPVYRRGSLRNTVAQRRAALLGFVYCPVMMSDFIQSVSPRLIAGIRLRIDAGSPVADRLYDSAPEVGNPSPLLTVSMPLAIGSGDWQMRYDAMPGFDAGSHTSHTVLLAGFCISALLFLITWNLARTRVMALAMAERMRRAHQGSEENFSATFEQAAMGIGHTDPGTSRYLRVNQKYCEILGYTRAELLGMRASDVVHPDDVKMNADARLALLEGRLASMTARKRCLRKSGDVVWVNFTMSVCRDIASGAAKFFIGVIEDISDQMRIERALQRSEASLRQVIDTMPIGVWVADETGRAVAANPEALRIWAGGHDMPLAAFGAYKAWDLQLGAAFAAEDWPLARALRRGEQVRDAMADIEAFDGARKTILMSAFPLHDAGGRLIGAVQTTQDITERRRAAVALEASEERFRSIFEQAAVGIALTDEMGRLLRVNNKFCEITGYERETLEGMRYQDISWPDDLPANLESMRRLLAGEITTVAFDKRYRHRDGQAVWVHMTVSLSHGSLAGNFCRFIAVAQDITERKRVDEAMRELTRHLHTVRETERTRIAREIHDDLGGILTAAKFDLSMAGEDQHPHVLGLIDAAIVSLRRIINDLRPSILDNLGLWAAIEWEARVFQARTGIGCAVCMDSSEVDVEPEAATALFRIFQESLTNVVKHAQARSVSVWAGVDTQGIELIVDDDGRGIDETDLRKTKSYGILGMHERAHMFHGTVQVTRLEQGTRVRIHLPLPA